MLLRSGPTYEIETPAFKLIYLLKQNTPLLFSKWGIPVFDPVPMNEKLMDVPCHGRV